MNIKMLSTVETAVNLAIVNRRGKPAVRNFGVKLLGDRVYGPVPAELRDRLVAMGLAEDAAADAADVVELPIPVAPA